MRTRHHLIAILLVSISCALVYFDTLEFPFVFDDAPNITDKAEIRLTKLDLSQLSEAGFSGPCARRPLSNISFALNYYADGYDVTGYRGVNILVHLVNGILVYFLSLVFLRQALELPRQGSPRLGVEAIPLVALLTALIYVTHPVQLQSVTYVVQRMNSLAVMFYLSSLLLYVQARRIERPRLRWALFAGCALLWIAALASKEISVTLPVIILLHEWFFLRDLRMSWPPARTGIVVGLLLVLGILAFVFAAGSPLDLIMSTYAERDFTLNQRMLTQLRVLPFYLGLVLFPHPARLNLLHHFETSHSLIQPLTTLVSLVFVLCLLAASMRAARRHRLVSFCVLWFFANMLMESSVLGLEMVYEYRLYLPMFGCALLVSTLLFQVAGAKRRWAMAVALVLVVSLALSTRAANSVWRDERALWSDVLMKNPQSDRAHISMGILLKNEGRLDEAVEHYEQALRIRPESEVAHNNLGNVLLRQRRFQAAISHYEEAIRIRPALPRAHYNLGNVLAFVGRLDEAVKHFSEVLAMEPNDERALRNLGTILGRLGRRREGITHLVRAVRLVPDDADAHRALADLLALEGHLPPAAHHLSEVIRIEPQDADAHYELGRVLARQQRFERAIEHFSAALAIEPEHRGARSQLERYSR